MLSDEEDDEYNNSISKSVESTMLVIRPIVLREICKLYDIDYKEFYSKKIVEPEVDLICDMIVQHLIISSLYTACNIDDREVTAYRCGTKISGENVLYNNYIYTNLQKRLFSSEDTYVNRLLQYLYIKNIDNNGECHRKYNVYDYESNVSYYFKLKYDKNKKKNEKKYSVPKNESSIYYITLNNANSFCWKSIQRLIDSQVYSMVRTVNKNLINFADLCIKAYDEYGFIEKTMDDKIDRVLAIYEFERYYNINYLQNIATNVVNSVLKKKESNTYLPIYDIGKMLPNVFSRNLLVDKMNELYYIKGEESLESIEEYLIHLGYFIFPLAEKIFFLNLYNCIKRKSGDGEFKEIVEKMKNVLIKFIKNEEFIDKSFSVYFGESTSKTSIFDMMYTDVLKAEEIDSKKKEIVVNQYSDAIKFLFQSKVQEQDSYNVQWLEDEENKNKEARKRGKKLDQIKEMDKMFNRTFSREYFFTYEFYTDIIEAVEKKFVGENK